MDVTEGVTSSRVSEEVKIALTLGVVFGALLIAALISIAYWYCNVYKARRKFGSSSGYKESLPRSLREIEAELREINNPATLSQEDAEGSSTERSTNELPSHSSTIDVTRSAIAKPSISDADEASSSNSIPISDIVVIRCDNNQHRDDDSSLTSYKFSQGPLRDTHIVIKAKTHETRSGTTTIDNRSELFDTRISTISSASQGPTARASAYDGILWPDVIDPYKRSKELEMKIGNRAIDVFQCQSMTTVLEFHK